MLRGMAAIPPGAAHVSIEMPGVAGRSGADSGGGKAERGDRAAVERVIIGRVHLVEGVGVRGQGHIAIRGVGGGDHTAPVAPDKLLFRARGGLRARGRGTVCAPLLAARLDAQAASGVARRLPRRVVAVGDVGRGGVLLHPGVDVLDVDRARFAPTGDLALERPDGPAQQRLAQGVVHRRRPVAQPPVARDRAFHVDTRGLRRRGHGPEADLQHEEGMLDQESTHLGDVLCMRAERDQQRLDVGGRRVRHRARPGARRRGRGDNGPVQMGAEGAVAPHDGIMIPHDIQRALVKRAAVSYHGSRLLGRMGGVSGIPHSATEPYPLPNPYIMLKPTLPSTVRPSYP